MVQLGDFSIQLVEPHSKLPYPEHYHKADEKTYVQLTEKAEYFIAVCKPRAKLFSGTVVLRFYVNGKYLGFNLTYTAAVKSWQPKYKGNWKRDEHGISTDTAIRFVAPEQQQQQQDDTSKTKPSLSFEKVKVKVYPAFVQTANVNGKLGYDKDCLLATITLYCGTRQALEQACVIQQVKVPVIQSIHNNNKNYECPEMSRPNKNNQTTRNAEGVLGNVSEEEDDSYSDHGSPTACNCKQRVNEEDFESDVVFVDPHMDVIAL